MVEALSERLDEPCARPCPSTRTPSWTADPGFALHARATAVFAYATAPRVAGRTATLCAPSVRTSSEPKAARTTAKAAARERPPTWIPLIVTPRGSPLGFGFGFGFGLRPRRRLRLRPRSAGVVVVRGGARRLGSRRRTLPVSVEVAVDVVAVGGGGDWAAPAGTSATSSPAPARARAIVPIPSARLIGSGV